MSDNERRENDMELGANSSRGVMCALGAVLGTGIPLVVVRDASAAKRPDGVLVMLKGDRSAWALGDGLHES